MVVVQIVLSVLLGAIGATSGATDYAFDCFVSISIFAISLHLVLMFVLLCIVADIIGRGKYERTDSKLAFFGYNFFVFSLILYIFAKFKFYN